MRLVGERRVAVVRDAAAVWRVLDENPIESCMVAARVADYGIEPNSIGGELWTRRGGVDESLCFAGANLIPLRGGLIDLNAFADEAKSTARRCSSLVGRADLVLPMWQRLESTWGPARDVRDHQPLMAINTHPSCAIDPEVRQVRPEELDAYLVAAVDMFIGEVGIDPRMGDGGRGYRRRVASLIAAGRAWARFEHGEVVFKAEVGSQSPSVGQIQGCGFIRSDAAWVGDRRYRDGCRGDRRQRAHRQPVREQLQHRRPCRLHASRVPGSGYLRHGAARLSRGAGVTPRRKSGSNPALALRTAVAWLNNGWVSVCRRGRCCQSS